MYITFANCSVKFRHFVLRRYGDFLDLVWRTSSRGGVRGGFVFRERAVPQAVAVYPLMESGYAANGTMGLTPRLWMRWSRLLQINRGG